MTPALIDVHVRQPAEVGVSAWAAQAREAGLDGILVVGRDLPPSVAPGLYDGVAVFCGVELDTEIGRVLGVPAEDDVWFRGAAWRALHDDERGYCAADVAREFVNRGGVVLLAQPYDRDLDHQACGDAFVGTDGIAGVIVASSPRHAASNERAAIAARRARLPALAGSASAPGQDRFGGVATLFAEGPQDQAALVAALLGGRLWPVEIEVPLALEESDDDGDEGEEPRGGEGAEPAGDERAGRSTAVLAGAKSAGAGAAKGKAKVARPEPPPRQRKAEREDNRGNRFDYSLLQRRSVAAHDERQPDIDPIAKLYGLADRPLESRFAHLSDDEIDRINGNRSRGPDPNHMAPLDFRETRAERAHVNLLLEAIDDRREEPDDSLALRFAVAAAQRVQAGTAGDGGRGHGPHGGQGATGQGHGHHGGNDPRRHKRRRRKG